MGFGQEVFGTALPIGRPDQTVTKNILLRYYRKAGRLEPMFQPPDRQMQAAFSDAFGIGDRDDIRQTLIFDQPGQTFPRAFGIAGDQNRTLFKLCINMRSQCPEKTYGFLLSLR